MRSLKRGNSRALLTIEVGCIRENSIRISASRYRMAGSARSDPFGRVLGCALTMGHEGLVTKETSDVYEL